MNNQESNDDDLEEKRPRRRSSSRSDERRARDDEDDDRRDDYRRRRSPDIGDDAGVRFLLPVGRSGWAIVAGYLGLISVLLIPAPFALLTGVLAIREMRRNPKKHGMGRAVLGIVMGSLFSIGLVALLIAGAASGFK